MTHEEATSWAHSLKVGDEVLVSATHESIGKVERITPAQIHINGTAYWKKDRSRVGASRWMFSYIYPLTPEKRIELIAQKRMNYAKAQFELLSRKLDQYSVEQLEAVIAILKPKEHVNGSQASTIVSTETHSA